MSNITIELTKKSTSAVSNFSFPFSNVAFIGCSCSSNNECSSYKATLPRGSYAFDCYGASGIDQSNNYSLGGHTYGIINLLHEEVFYLYVGQQGVFEGPKTFGGGGKGNRYSWAGGGATDIRLIDGDDFDALKSRIMVAAGGGGYSTYHNNHIGFGDKGNAGGLEGEGGGLFKKESNVEIVTTLSKGGTQVKGGDGGISPEDGNNYLLSEERNGTFGNGGSTNYGSGGGGGGYFGGGAGKTYLLQVGSGAGGSSYISGHEGCYSISRSSTNTTIKMIKTPFHYSGLFFKHTKMSSISSSDRNLGNGYIIITFIGDLIDVSCKKSSFKFIYPGFLSCFIFLS